MELTSIWFALRSLLKRPGFTVVAVLTLALGIAANVVVFGVVEAVLLRPLPYPEPQRLVRIWESNHREGFDRFEVSVPNFLDWRQSKSFESLAAYSTSSVTLTGLGDPEVLTEGRVTTSLLSTLRVQPRLGRGFTADDGRPGAHVVLLSHSLWQRLFGADPATIGRRLALNGQGYTVVGVLSRSFQFGSDEIGIWAPLQLVDDESERAARVLDVVGRLRAGRSLAQATRELETIAGRLQREHPAANSGWSVATMSLPDVAVEAIRPALRVLLFAVGFVLLIACGNVASLMLVSTAGRSRELAVRQAMGAGPGRLAGQLLAESAVLALAAAVVGLLLAALGLRLLLALSPGNIPRLSEVAIDARVVLFTAAIAALTVLLAGALPALQAARPAANEALKEGGRTGAPGRSSRRLRSAFVVGELALAMVLLFGAVLLIRSFWRLQSVDPGFHSRNLLVARVSLPPSRYGDLTRRTALYQQLLQRARALPGVVAASVTSALPLHDWYFSFQIEGRPQAATGDKPQLLHRAVSADYFRTMGIRVLAGRVLTDRDRAGAPGVVVVDRAMVRKYFPNTPPIGMRISFDDPPQWLTIVGEVAEVRQLGLAAESVPGAYVSALQTAGPRMYLLVRTSRDPRQLVAALRREVRDVDPDIPLYGVQTMEERLSSSIAQPRFNTWLLAIFSLLALALAVVGIYGVISQSVSQRRFEIGTRMALGARRRDVLLLVLAQGAGLVGLGLAIGWAGALAVSHLLQGALVGIDTGDPLALGVVILLLGLVALLACYIPARRATGVDPLLALKSQ